MIAHLQIILSCILKSENSFLNFLVSRTCSDLLKICKDTKDSIKIYVSLSLKDKYRCLELFNKFSN